ncbi:hypothetical protein BGX33_001168 [Mortierella sp. NVP41]|nr:hypothetical protein BGX33_001168 [Mortierella sp. NVP41]
MTPNTNNYYNLGTYLTGATIPTRGYLIVFDQTGGGSVFPTTGVWDITRIANSTTVIELSAPQSVQMTGIVLTSKAISATLGDSTDSAYIFDQATDGSLALYTINPSKSYTLQKVAMSGTIPSSARTMTAAASGSQIALYATENGTSKLSIFDIASGTWTGSTPIYAGSGTLPSPTNGTSPISPTSDSLSHIPLGAIIGGIAGGVVLIALVLFFVIHRRRRRGYKHAAAAEVPPAVVYHDHDIPKLTNNYVVHQPEQQHYTQQQQVYTLPQDVYAMTPQQQQQYYAPVDPNNTYNNNRQSSISLPAYQTQPIGVVAVAEPYLQPYTYTYIPPTIVPSHPSPTIFQAQAQAQATVAASAAAIAAAAIAATEGSPLTAHESAAPKVRGSPQATTVSMDMPPGLSMSAPRNPQMSG